MNRLFIYGRRLFSGTGISGAKTLDVQIGNYSPSKKGTRRERAEKGNLISQNKLYLLDSEFNIFNQNVTKVLDLGYVPGNWSQVAKMQLSQVHGLDESTFNTKCHVLGLDTLFAEPIANVSTIQGNIYSKKSHALVIDHFREVALRGLERRKLIRKSNNDIEADSYFTKEKLENIISAAQSHIDFENLGKNSAEIDLLALKLQDLSFGDYSQSVTRQEIIDSLDYKPQVVLSDLTSPFVQTKGFYVNTFSRPYAAMNTLESLNKPILEPHKASFDLADASLMLVCKVLRESGTFVLRLSRINPQDGELELLELRLQKVFNNTRVWGNYNRVISNNSYELFFICMDKKPTSEFDVRDIF